MWEYEKHTQIQGFLRYSGQNKNMCSLQIMENVNSRVVGKLRLFQTMDSLQYFRLS